MRKLTFIVPVYNVGEFLRDCIESILKLSYQNKEILLVNDGSTDSSGKICEFYGERYPDLIIVINQENGGLSDARNTGINMATGDFLFFIDADDFLRYDFSKEIINLINNENHDFILFQYQEYYNRGNVFKVVKTNITREMISYKSGREALNSILDVEKNFQWIACRGIYRRQFIIENNIYFQKGRYYEDMLWLPEIFLKARSMDYIDSAFYVYRLEREGQITSTISKKTLSDNIYIVDYWFKKIGKSIGKNKLEKKIMSNVAIRYFYVIWFCGFLEKNDKKELINELSMNKNFLRFKSTALTKVTAIMCKMLGINSTSTIFKLALTFKRILKTV